MVLAAGDHGDALYHDEVRLGDSVGGANALVDSGWRSSLWHGVGGQFAGAGGVGG